MIILKLMKSKIQKAVYLILKQHLGLSEYEVGDFIKNAFLNRFEAMEIPVVHVKINIKNKN
jgi:hypothetical protein